MAGAQHGRRQARVWPVVTLTIAIGLLLGMTVAWAASLGGADPPGTQASASGTVQPSPSRIPQVSAPSVPSTQPVELPSSAFDTERFSLDDPDSPWVVVNKARPLEPADHVPDDLVQVSGVTFVDGGTLRREAADALSAMEKAATAKGLGFQVSSAYRGFARQSDIYHTNVNKSGEAKADRFSARPGYSEHQTGWSADLYDSSACRLKACFGDSAAGQWVAAHGAEYGFIIRYPEGKSSVTGYEYEPWHVRYVGEGLAMQMRERNAVTLEEFFGLPAAPTY